MKHFILTNKTINLHHFLFQPVQLEIKNKPKTEIRKTKDALFKAVIIKIKIKMDALKQTEI